MIRPDVMQAFVYAFAGSGFKAQSFCPSYGLAEATLAVTVHPHVRLQVAAGVDHGDVHRLADLRGLRRGGVDDTAGFLGGDGLEH